MHRFLLASLLVCLGVTAATAQTKISGTLQCGKADPQQIIPVGDRPNHSLGVEQFKCTWSKPIEIEGTKSKDDVSTATLEINGNNARDRGVGVSTTDTGDKFFTPYQGTSTVKDGAFQTGKGTWTFSGGTGKLKGLKGKGSYSCAPSSDGVTCEVEGEYQLAK